MARNHYDDPMTTNTEDFTALDIVEIAKLERDFSRAFLIALIVTFVIDVLTLGQSLGIILLLLLVKFLILLWSGVKFSKLLWYIPKNRMIFLIAYWLSAPLNSTIILVVVSIALMIINDNIFRKRNLPVGFFGGDLESFGVSKKKISIKKRYFLILAVLIEIGFFVFIARPSTVKGISMAPNLTPGSIIMVNLWYRDIKRGDIVKFNSVDPSSRDRVLIKRVIAIGGDKIKMNKGLLYVNGQRFDDNKILDFWKKLECWDETSNRSNIAEMTVPVNQYYVIGDNRTKLGSSDSRNMGTIPKSNIIGKIIQISSDKLKDIDYCQSY